MFISEGMSALVSLQGNSLHFIHSFRALIIGSTDPEGSSLRERVMTILLSSRGLLNVAHLDVQIKLSPLSQGERFHMFGTWNDVWPHWTGGVSPSCVTSSIFRLQVLLERSPLIISLSQPQNKNFTGWPRRRA